MPGNLWWGRTTDRFLGRGGCCSDRLQVGACASLLDVSNSPDIGTARAESERGCCGLLQLYFCSSFCFSG